MKAITVRQPWALHIMQSGKEVENRTRNIAGTYRGPIVIHAAKVADEEALRALPRRPPNGIPRIFYYGEALGIVELTGVHDSSDCWDADFRRLARLYRAEGSAAISHLPDNGAGGLIGKARHCSTWALPDHQHLALANPRYFPEPIPYRGRLGLWEFPDELLPDGVTPAGRCPYHPSQPKAPECPDCAAHQRTVITDPDHIRSIRQQAKEQQ